MKRCPTCKRSFEDDSLAYCLDDGSPLVPETGPESEATLVTPSPSLAPPPPPTQFAQYQPAAPPVGAVPKRRVWPWVVGGLVVFFFLVMGIVAAVAFRLVKNPRNSNRH